MACVRLQFSPAPVLAHLPIIMSSEETCPDEQLFKKNDEVEKLTREEVQVVSVSSTTAQLEEGEPFFKADYVKSFATSSDFPTRSSDEVH